MENLRTTDLPPIFATRDLPSHVSQKVLRRKGIVKVTAGVYRRTDLDHTDAEQIIAVHRSLPGSVISGLSAAQLYGMRVESSRKVYLTGQKRFRRDLIVGSMAHLAPEDIWETDTYQLTSPSRTFLDLGTKLTVRELVKVTDGLINYHEHRSTEPPRMTLTALNQYLDQAPPLKGKNKCYQALKLAVVGSDSPQETELRLVLNEYGIKGLVANPPISNEFGWVMFEPDLADFEHRISIQYEGAHHGSTRQMRKDEDRLRKTRDMGWIEVKIFASDLKEFVNWNGEFIPRAVAKVKEAQASRRP